jgi:transcriptional regulator with XRE-family HTH domain
MNKILATARMAKGLTEKQMADQLKMGEAEYRELELSLRELPYEFAEKLEDLHNVPAEFFLNYDCHGIKTCISALEKQKEIIAATGVQNISISAQTHLSIAKMGLDALIAKQEQIILLKRINELEIENRTILELYKRAKSK